MGVAASAADASVWGVEAPLGSGDTRGDAPRTQPSGQEALAALCAIARFHQLAADVAGLRHRLGLSPRDRVGSTELLRGAKLLGLKARRIRTRADRLAHTPLPALALMRDAAAQGADDGVCILAQCDGQRVLLSTPQRAGGPSQPQPSSPDARMPAGGPRIEPIAEFAARWTGELILFTSRASETGDLVRFDFSWFVPALVKYRWLLGEVLLVSLVLQLVGLVSPLFFQVVMDKVLVHKAVTTLDVLVIGLVIVVVFESLLSALRTLVFSHTTSRIDIELGSRLFRHLVALPLAYFQARRVGDSVARVRELENIRTFLTGNALTVLLDLVFSVVFIALMAWYSLPLTLIVLASLPLYAALSLLVTPVLRRRLDIQFARGAENQAMLVETVTGIQTVKAAALEPGFAGQWDRQLAAYVQAGLRTRILAALAHEGVNLVGKLVSAATLWYGAHLVMANTLTVGQFVAFTMFAQRVAQPVMRLAQLWTDFQQTGVSMARLGDILNTRTEVSGSGGQHLPVLTGRLRLEQVRFRYQADAPAVLHGIDLDVAAGEVVGIVGRSGSGKSTLGKLVQRLHSPQGGRLLVDGVDMARIDAAQLRRQMGVVLQENVLFNRSVRENIAVADPGAPIEDVMQAARLAGAHEFVTGLPQGYETSVGEQGCHLSGGQRQRIALARALFTRPRILILDEATSALDYESEAIIQRNMAQICRGRTVLIVAHRLSAVRHAHRIVVLEQGRIVQVGRHDALLRETDGVYAWLWALQAGGPAADGGGP